MSQITAVNLIRAELRSSQDVNLLHLIAFAEAIVDGTREFPNMSVGEIEEISDHEGTETDPGAEFTDLNIICIDCRQNFVWTAGEQTFYRDKGLINPPKRCRPCKKRKNERLAAIEVAHSTGQRHHIEVSAECACCSTVTTVPFYPSQGRPVYCRACYLKQNGSTSQSEIDSV